MSRPRLQPTEAEIAKARQNIRLKVPRPRPAFNTKPKENGWVLLPESWRIYPGEEAYITGGQVWVTRGGASLPTHTGTTEDVFRAVESSGNAQEGPQKACRGTSYSQKPLTKG